MKYLKVIIPLITLSLVFIIEYYNNMFCDELLYQKIIKK